jgi:hypothetical protein
MNFLLFLAPFSWGTRERRLLLPKREDAFSEGHDKSLTADQKISWEEPNKAESTKLPGAGISLKLCPGNCVAEKGRLPDTVRNRDEGQAGLQPLAQKDFQDSRPRSEMTRKGNAREDAKGPQKPEPRGAAQYST